MNGGSLVGIALRAVAGSAVSALLLGASACGAQTAPIVAPIVTSAPAPGSSDFGGTDRAWIELTIAMDEEVIPLLDLAPTRGSDPAVQAIVAEIRAGNERELGTLRRLRDQAQLPTENPHKGMPMPGIVTPEQLTEAAAARGAAFDKLMIKHLEAHLRQGAQLAGSEEKAGVEPQTRSLAAQVITSRKRSLAKLATV